MFGSENRSLSWQHQCPEKHESIIMANLDYLTFFLWFFHTSMIYLSWNWSPRGWVVVSAHQSPSSGRPCPEYTNITWDYAALNFPFSQLKNCSLWIGFFSLVDKISSSCSLSPNFCVNRSMSNGVPSIYGDLIFVSPSGATIILWLALCVNLLEAVNINAFTLL